MNRISYTPPGETTKLYADEFARWDDIIRKAGIKAD